VSRRPLGCLGGVIFPEILKSVTENSKSEYRTAAATLFSGCICMLIGRRADGPSACFWFISAMIHMEPATTTKTMSTPNASARDVVGAFRPRWGDVQEEHQIVPPSGRIGEHSEAQSYATLAKAAKCLAAQKGRRREEKGQK